MRSNKKVKKLLYNISVWAIIIVIVAQLIPFAHASGKIIFPKQMFPTAHVESAKENIQASVQLSADAIVDYGIAVETEHVVPETQPISTEPATEPAYEPILFGEDITFTHEYVKSDDIMPYMVYTPSTANDGGDIPLIVWLHGSGEKDVSAGAFEYAGLPYVLNNWKLAGFNAYVICPQLIGKWNSGVWCCDVAVENLKNVIDEFVKTHNVDTNKIIITGHSLGGQGALYAALKLPEYFSKMAVLSGYSINGDISEIQIPARGYAENTGSSYSYMKSTFAPVFGEDVTEIYNTYHGDIPRAAFHEDKDQNNISDLLEWMFAD